MATENQTKKWNKKILLAAGAVVLAVLVLAGVPVSLRLQRVRHTAATVVMDTMASQIAYGPRAQRAMREVNAALAAFDDEMTMHEEGGDIARINEAAGRGGADVSDETVALLQKALGLSAQSEGAFAVTIAPLTLAWGVTSDAPRVPPQSEIDALLPLVNDAGLHINGNHAALETEGMAIDLGGIAKGEACSMALEIYKKYTISSALLDIGGSSIYALGTKPDGTAWRIGFRNPEAGSGASIASFTLENRALGMSGGYERFFEAGGERYIHIIDPRTGRPAESDIISVGAVHEDGAAADFWATTLFVWGKTRTLEYMRDGGTTIFLDDAGTLYVSESLRNGFEMQQWAEDLYTVEFVPGG